VVVVVVVGGVKGWSAVACFVAAAGEAGAGIRSILGGGGLAAGPGKRWEAASAAAAAAGNKGDDDSSSTGWEQKVSCNSTVSECTPL